MCKPSVRTALLGHAKRDPPEFSSSNCVLAQRLWWRPRPGAITSFRAGICGTNRVLERRDGLGRSESAKPLIRTRVVGARALPGPNSRRHPPAIAWSWNVVGRVSLFARSNDVLRARKCQRRRSTSSALRRLGRREAAHLELGSKCASGPLRKKNQRAPCARGQLATKVPRKLDWGRVVGSRHSWRELPSGHRERESMARRSRCQRRRGGCDQRRGR